MERLNLLKNGKCKELVVGLILAASIIFVYNARNVDASNLALGKDTLSVSENWGGKTFTAYSPKLIKELVEETLASVQQGKSSYWLWLGNSQLHAINQVKGGDHLAPYWARESLSCSDCTIPLGVSIPNANLQEFLLLSRYVERKLNIKGMIIELPFIGLREDGIRDELNALVDPPLEADLSRTPAGKDVVKSIGAMESKGSAVGSGQGVGTKNEDFQAKLESHLENEMGNRFPIWKQRSQMKTNFLVDLYFAKNWLFNIKPNTVRKVIAIRYDRNMRALEDILMRSKDEHVPAIVYIAPIRQDIQLPYDPMEYEIWKGQVQKLSEQYGAKFFNLEKLVPVNYWGTYIGDNIDFMHFQGPGHRIVGTYLGKYLVQ